ncbi:MAG: hypothetical protein ACR2FY_16775 [Pirellulaceae bacterium]
MRSTMVTAAIPNLFVAILLGGCGEPPQPAVMKPTVQAAELSPGDVVKAWNDALAKGDVKSAADRTSSTSNQHIKQNFGSLEQLSAVYQKGMKDLKVETKIVYEEIDGDTAMVVYRVQYGDKTVKFWLDKLFREAGDWKVAPQFVQTLTLKE